MHTTLRTAAPFPASSAVVTSLPVSPLSKALDAIATLANAKWSDLFVFDREAGSIVPLVGGTARQRGITLTRRLVAILGADGERSARDTFIWVSEPIDGDMVLLLEFARQDGLTSLAVLGFDKADVTCQVRLTGMMSSLAMLLQVIGRLFAEARELEKQRIAVAMALDNLDFGVVGVGDDHTPLMMNRVVQAMLASDGPIQLCRGLVRPTDPRDAVRFHVALDSVIASQSGPGTQAAEAYMMLLGSDRPQAGNGDKTILLIAPARGAQLGTGAPDGVAALVYVFRPEMSDVRGLEPLCHLLGLSGAETRLLSHLLIGRTVAEAATRMRIKQETARTYLKQAFAKTGTHRQTDLVALLHRYLLTIRGRFTFKPI